MEKAGYRQWETEQNGMQVILEFPERSAEEENIKNEVRQILSSLLCDTYTLPEHVRQKEASNENKQKTCENPAACQF